MTRPLLCAVLCLFAACRDDDSHARPPSSEIVDVVIDDAIGCRMEFRLPDAEWRRVEDPAFKGFRFEADARELRVRIFLKDAAFKAAADQARAQADGAEIRAFEAWTGWPFVGVVVEYRGPSDAAMLETFVHSFKVERR